MLVVGGLRALHLVTARSPGAQIDHLASLGAERTKAISRREVGGLLADGALHRELPSSRKLSDERAMRNAALRDGEPDHRERRHLDRDRKRKSAPRNRGGLDPAHVAEVGPAVRSRVGVENLAIPSGLGHANAIA